MVRVSCLFWSLSVKMATANGQRIPQELHKWHCRTRGIVPRCWSEDIADNASRRATGDSTKDFDRRYTPQHISAKYPWCGRPTARVPALRSVAYARHERVGSRWSIGWAGSRRSRRRQGRPSRFGGQYVHPAADVSSGEYGLNSLSFDLRVTQRWIGGTDVPVFGLVSRKQSRGDQGA